VDGKDVREKLLDAGVCKKTTNFQTTNVVLAVNPLNDETNEQSEEPAISTNNENDEKAPPKNDESEQPTSQEQTNGKKCIQINLICILKEIFLVLLFLNYNE
jgi:hypothetical protein